MISGPVGPRNDITSKSEFFASLIACNEELKSFLRRNAEGLDKNSFESKSANMIDDQSLQLERFKKHNRCLISVAT
jgi:hypothetical protein